MVAKKKKVSKSKASKSKKKSTSKKTVAKKKSTKKAPVKKAVAKKKSTKKAPVKKAVAKKTVAKKTTSKKAPKKSKKSTKSAKSTSSTKKGTTKSARKKDSSASKKLNYSTIDKQILTALTNSPNNSLVIDQIVENLKFSEEDIEKSIKRLENKTPPKIRTKVVMYQSKWVNQLTKIDDYGIKPVKTAKTNKLVWDTVGDLSCYICPYARKCNAGQEHYNPKNCPYLTDWLVSSISVETYTGNPFHQDYESKKSKKK
ncbi:MAG: hypothetical protein ACTSYU_01710 [Promethearchaeota archaeon]